MSTPARPAARPAATPDQLRSALRIYRVLAVVAGIALFVLVLEMVLKYGLDQKNFLTEYWSPIHGLIYFAYACSIVNLGFKSRWSLVRIVLNLLSGFVPFVPFVAERRVTRSTEALIASLEGQRAAGAPRAAQ
ncbi:DUF3817 domain-containing protein [Lapillicoccus jejuensis]|uniref:Integral membrane protein n=1 Tax=Lapillicoccus jejuensis TaxID=402171 RepID=A0A542E1X3_9MICO|nr:DUF3817 domain-containing protein [Lapillicoccus jejuensis]TQJ09340.1 integral membrane protein [Lapillicoccus jejuensis]